MSGNLASFLIWFHHIIKYTIHSKTVWTWSIPFYFQAQHCYWSKLKHNMFIKHDIHDQNLTSLFAYQPFSESSTLTVTAKSQLTKISRRNFIRPTNHLIPLAKRHSIFTQNLQEYRENLKSLTCFWTSASLRAMLLVCALANFAYKSTKKRNRELLEATNWRGSSGMFRETTTRRMCERTSTPSSTLKTTKVSRERTLLLAAASARWLSISLALVTIHVSLSLSL